MTARTSRSSAAGRTARAGICAPPSGARTTISTMVVVRRLTWRTRGDELVVEPGEERAGAGRRAAAAAGVERRRFGKRPRRRAGSRPWRSPSPSPRCPRSAGGCRRRTRPCLPSLQVAGEEALARLARRRARRCPRASAVGVVGAEVLLPRVELEGAGVLLLVGDVGARARGDADGAGRQVDWSSPSLRSGTCTALHVRRDRRAPPRGATCARRSGRPLRGSW